MIDSISLTNYKVFKKLEIHNLGLINIVTGDNGVGKSSLLKGLSAKRIAYNMYNINAYSQLALCKDTYRIYANVSRSKIDYEHFMQGLRQTFPEFHIGYRLETIAKMNGDPVVIIPTKNGVYHSITDFGYAVNAFYHLFGRLLTHSDCDVIGIDGIDIPFGSKRFFKITKFLHLFANRTNTQLFLTTDNIEFIEECVNSIKDLSDENLEKDLRLITLTRYNTGTRARILNGADLYKALDYGLEVRY